MPISVFYNDKKVKANGLCQENYSAQPIMDTDYADNP